MIAMHSLKRKIKTQAVQKPWGKFEQFTHNESTTIKILSVGRGEAFSLQYHNNRNELWRIISGAPEITIGESVVIGKRGDEFEIPPKTKHRVRSLETDTEILEISFGDFDEEDIVRLEDKYGRA